MPSTTHTPSNNTARTPPICPQILEEFERNKKSFTEEMQTSFERILREVKDKFKEREKKVKVENRELHEKLRITVVRVAELEGQNGQKNEAFQRELRDLKDVIREKDRRIEEREDDARKRERVLEDERSRVRELMVKVELLESGGAARGGHVSEVRFLEEKIRMIEGEKDSFSSEVGRLKSELESGRKELGRYTVGLRR